MDVAQLGVEVRSNGIDKTTGDLNKLSGAAARAEAATDGLAGSNRGATGAASAAAKAYASEGAAASSASKQIEMMNRAANQNRSSSRGNISNIAAQFQDIAVTAAMAMNPMQIALQQGTQLVGVLGTMERPLAGLASAFMALLSPLSLVTIALVALAAAGLQMVDWPRLAAWALRELADALEVIAPYAVAAAAALALFYAPAIIGGIISLIAWLGRLVIQLGIVAAAFIAANPVVAFVAGITLAVAAANVFREEIAQIFGRDVVGDIKNAANFVINSFEAAFADIQFIWNNLPSIIGAAVIGAANATIRALTDLVQRGADMIDTLRKKVNEYLPEMLQSELIGDLGLSGLELPNPYSAGLSDAVAERNANLERIMGQDRVGQFGEAISRGASTAAEKLRELAKGLVDVDEKSKKSSGRTKDDPYQNIVEGANARLASLQAEQQALGLSEQAAAKLRYETDMLNQAQRAGITLTATQRAELSGLAEQMAATEVATRKAQEALQFVKSTTAGFVNDLRNGLKNGEGFWQSFGKAALNVLDRITDRLLDGVMDALFQINGAGSGSGGLFGGLLSLTGLGGGSDPWSGMRTAGSSVIQTSAGAGLSVAPVQQMRSAAVNSNVAASATPPREFVLRVIGEEGPMFRPTIRSESEDVVVKGLRNYDQAKANLRQNGEAA